MQIGRQLQMNQGGVLSRVAANALTLAIVLALSSFASFASFPRAQAAYFRGEGKGTIGIVCIDPYGLVHFWNEENQIEYNQCMDEVIQSWGKKETPANGGVVESKDEGIELIQGMSGFRKSVQRLREAR